MIVLRRAALLALPLLLLLGLLNPAQAFPLIKTPSRAIEGYAPYQGQTICSPTAKPGMAALRNLILATYRGTGDYGIVRDCGVGGRSEHKEGRAWDWAVNAGNAAHVRQVNDMLMWALANDRYGNKFAQARRLGIMYIIWNRRIWHAGSSTWKTYTGSDPHTNHVHISLGWAGALKKTSYWTGVVSPVLGANGRPLPVVQPPPPPPPPPILPPVLPPGTSDVLETLTVPATAAELTTSVMQLEAGKRYLLIATGTYHYAAGSLPADAECSRAPASSSWQRRTPWEEDGSYQGPAGHLDLEVQGEATRWSSRIDASCDPAGHTYLTVLEPTTTAALTLRIVDDVYTDNSGALKVMVRELPA